MRTVWKLFIIAVAGLAGLYFAMRYVQAIDFINSDFFTFYLAGWLIRTGQSPYSAEHWRAGRELFQATWFPEPTFLYPLPLAVLSAPLSLIPLDKAFTLWITLSQACVVAAILLLSFYAGVPLKWPVVLPLLAGAFIFRPTIVTFTNGQLGAVFLLVIAITIVLWQRQRWFLGGMLIALLSLKPSWGIFLLLLISLWLLFSRRWSALAGMAVTGAWLAGIGLWFNPSWPQQFISISTSKLSGSLGLSPTLWGVTTLWCGDQAACITNLGLVFTVLSLGLTGILYYWQRRSLTPIDAMAIACAVSVVVTPYLWAYDQILLLVTVVAAVLHGSRRQLPYLVLTLYLIVFAVLSISLIFVAMRTGRDTWSALIPLTALLVLLVCSYDRLWGRSVMAEPL